MNTNYSNLFIYFFFLQFIIKKEANYLANYLEEEQFYRNYKFKYFIYILKMYKKMFNEIKN